MCKSALTIKTEFHKRPKKKLPMNGTEYKRNKYVEILFSKELRNAAQQFFCTSSLCQFIDFHGYKTHKDCFSRRIRTN